MSEGDDVMSGGDDVMSRGDDVKSRGDDVMSDYLVSGEPYPIGPNLHGRYGIDIGMQKIRNLKSQTKKSGNTS